MSMTTENVEFDDAQVLSPALVNGNSVNKIRGKETENGMQRRQNMESRKTDNK